MCITIRTGVSSTSCACHDGDGGVDLLALLKRSKSGWTGTVQTTARRGGDGSAMNSRHGAMVSESCTCFDDVPPSPSGRMFFPPSLLCTFDEHRGPSATAKAVGKGKDQTLLRWQRRRCPTKTQLPISWPMRPHHHSVLGEHTADMYPHPPDAEQAISRLAPREAYDRAFRLRQASQQSVLHRELPKEQWVTKEEVCCIFPSN